VLPARPAIAPSGAALVVLAVSAKIIGHWHGPDIYILIALVGLVYLTGQLGQANDQAERLLAELEGSRAAEARAAGLAGRQRLAREMHDVVAHSLSGLLLLKLVGAGCSPRGGPADRRIPDTVDEAHLLAKVRPGRRQAGDRGAARRADARP